MWQAILRVSQAVVASSPTRKRLQAKAQPRTAPGMGSRSGRSAGAWAAGLPPHTSARRAGKGGTGRGGSRHAVAGSGPEDMNGLWAPALTTTSHWRPSPAQRRSARPREEREPCEGALPPQAHLRLWVLERVRLQGGGRGQRRAGEARRGGAAGRGTSAPRLAGLRAASPSPPPDKLHAVRSPEAEAVHAHLIKDDHVPGHREDGVAHGPAQFFFFEREHARWQAGRRRLTQQASHAGASKQPAAQPLPALGQPGSVPRQRGFAALAETRLHSTHRRVP